MKIVSYSEHYKEKWDLFVENSKNGTFLFKRNYMDYHNDRFEDCSFIILDEKEKVTALIPGTVKDKTYFTHRGLTYGGFILDRDSKTVDVMEYFLLLNNELRKIEIERVIYKKIPYIYSEYPSEEEDYALFRLGAHLKIVNIASTINLREPLKFNKSRKSCISKAKRFNPIIECDTNYEEFWKIMNENLKNNHNAKPVHTILEILKLKDFFPKEIKLYTISLNEEVIAGTVIYEKKETIHVQYISANEKGKEIGALDFLFDKLIKETYQEKKYFDFGTSTEDDGKYLNEGLIFQKEGFGARGICYRIYEYKLD